jgi:hypothetical protein
MAASALVVRLERAAPAVPLVIPNRAVRPDGDAGQVGATAEGVVADGGCLGQALAAIGEAVFLYNTKRPHLSLNYETPEKMHREAA